MMELVSKNGYKRKANYATYGRFGTNKRDLRGINIYKGVYDNQLNIMCPKCGVYHGRTIVGEMVPDDQIILGNMRYTVICGICNTVYRYDSKRYLDGGEIDPETGCIL